ncbi:inorganic diphosphatase [[Mycoplasma] collis]|uniref:inorganic diphosphatase n=1 Tax=[Mycoplasma] collis TaxID=2127 RepID=UPI00051C72B6|nr:inorganic diphosphatase [[Mycoplasma] collis]
MKKIVTVNIEIPKNSNIKYEYDRERNQIVVDRILRDGFRYPANYGSLREALDWDGDELDVLVYSNEEFLTGSALNARIIGAMKMIDDGETDTKLIAVHEDDYRLDNINKLEDLPKWWLREIEIFFSNYKNWKRPNITSIEGFGNTEWAINEYNECVELMQKYGNLPKKDFIKLMKEKHPDKYK